MFQSLKNSWELTKVSWHVLLADKELLIFPLVSFIASLIVMATFAVPLFLAGIFDEAATGGLESVSGAIVIIMTFLMYFVLYFVSIFASSALVGAAMIRLKGGNPTLRDGWDIAMKNINAIAGYAAIAATVGVILNQLSQRGGIFGQIASSLGGMAWSLATFLVVPVLVAEGVGPMEAVKRSSSLLKKTWGEQIAGNAGIGGIFALIIIGVIFLFVGLFALVVQTNQISLIIALVIVMVLTILIIGLISSALSSIYVAAVYRYTATGEVGTYFDAELLKSSFKTKR